MKQYAKPKLARIEITDIILASGEDLASGLLNTNLTGIITFNDDILNCGSRVADLLIN